MINGFLEARICLLGYSASLVSLNLHQFIQYVGAFMSSSVQPGIISHYFGIETNSTERAKAIEIPKSDMYHENMNDS